MSNAGDTSPPPKPGLAKGIAEDAREKGKPQDAFIDLKRQSMKGDIEDKRRYARWMLRLMTGQILIADVGFFFHGFFGGWDISASVMYAWLGATVIEVIGVVIVIVQYLFPRGGQDG